MIKVSGSNTKRIIAVFLSVIMIAATFCGTFGFRSFAAEGTDTVSATFSTIMKNDAPTGYVASDLKNPYSNDKNKFTIVEDDELLLFRSFNVNDTATKEVKNIGTSTYDKFKNGTDDSMNICDDLKSMLGGWTSYTDTVCDTGVKDKEDYTHGLNASQSIAFDPDGTGYNDHVAYVGFDGGGNVNVWVYDTTTDTYGSQKYIGSTYGYGMSYYAAKKYISITAGDYNNDGKDTFVIYYPGSKEDQYKGTNYKLLEYSVDSNDNVKNIDWNRSDLHPSYADQTNLMASASWNDKLGCDLTTGDFDSDGVDDLGVISYVQEPSTKNLNKSDASLYTPYVTVAFGGNDVQSGTILDSQVKQSMYIKLKQEKGDNDTVCASMRFPSISAGDINGDGYDELIAAGFYSKVKTNTPGYETAIDYDKITAENIVVKKDSISGSGSTFDANGWTKGVVNNKGEKYGEVLCVECVAFNGQAAKEQVFINGTVYNVSDGIFSAAYTPDYFTKNDEYIHDLVDPKSGAIEAVAGVFDGNDQGREQLMVCFYMNEHGYGTDFFFGVGAIFGADYDDNNIAGSIKSSEFNGWALSNCGGANNQRLSFCMAAVDRDHDSILGSYTGKEYTYTDPKVAAVLQAGPYFSGIDDAGGYANSCETAYSVSIDYETGTSSGNNVSFGAGVAASVEAEVGVTLSRDLSLGYSLDWTESFEKSTLKEYTTEFSTYKEDQVVISRIPIIVYNYRVYSKNKTSEDKAMSISVPGNPSYTTLSIEDYNAFVDEYNSKLDSSVAEYNKKVGDGKKLTSDNKLIKITKGTAGTGIHMPADVAGSPENYWRSWSQAPNDTGTALSKTPLTLGYSGGNLSSTFETSTTETESTEISHGFSFECQSMIGAGALGNTAKVGTYVSLDYLHTTGSFKSTTTGTSTTGKVENIDEASLLGAGMSKSVIRSYGFTWEFGTWRAPLTTADAEAKIQNEYTPFFGYIVYNLSQPPKAPENLNIENSDNDSMHELIASWDKSDDALVQGYNLYVYQDGEYVKLNSSLISKNQTEYTVSGLDSNTEYSFVITSYGYLDNQKLVKGESSYSVEATGKTTRDSYELTITTDRGASVDAEAAGKAVASGEKVAEDEAVSIEVTPKDGYTVTSVVLKRDGLEDKDITSADGKFNFAMTGQAEVVVTTERMVKSGMTVIEYSSNSDNDGNPLGTVEASADGEEFSTGAEIYCDSVLLKAEPNEGYVLQKWVVKTEGKANIEVKANGSLEYTFGPFASKHEICAYFVKSDDPSVNVKVTARSGEHGNIKVSDAEGTEIEGTGEYTVNVGSKLKFEVAPDRGYKLDRWTGDLSVLDNKVTEYEATVFEDMSFGAEFYAPVKYKVTYAPNNKTMGTVTSDVSSGSSVIPGDDVVLTATANEGYRLAGWTIERGSNKDTVEFTAEEDGLVTSNEYTLSNVKTNCKVTADFVEIEKYDVTISKTGIGSGDVYLLKADSTKVEDGGTLQYADKVTLVAEAEDGSYMTSLELNGEPAENGDEILALEDVTIAADFALIAEEPEAIEGLVFNGDEQTGVEAGTGYTLTGNTAVNPGEYTATATLETGYVWSDGSTEPKDISWSIESIKIDVPEAVEGLVYNEAEQTGVEAGTGYTLVGNTAVDAGEYTATATLETGYAWSDGSTEPKDISWSIERAKIDVPEAIEGLVYNEAEQTGVEAGTGYTLTGNTATMNGSYTAVAVLDSNYQWSDGSLEDKNISWTIERAKVAAPKAVKGLVYNKKTQTGVKAGKGYTLSGNTAKNAGKYTATAKLKAGYQWADGSLAAKKISWSIAKAKQPVKISTTVKTVKKSIIHRKSYVIKNAIKVEGAKGKVTYTKMKTSNVAYGICTINEKTGKITMGIHTCVDQQESHILKVKVKVAETANYRPYTKIVYVKMEMSPHN